MSLATPDLDEETARRRRGGRFALATVLLGPPLGSLLVLLVLGLAAAIERRDPNELVAALALNIVGIPIAYVLAGPAALLAGLVGAARIRDRGGIGYGEAAALGAVCAAVLCALTAELLSYDGDGIRPASLLRTGAAFGLIGGVVALILRRLLASTAASRPLR